MEMRAYFAALWRRKWVVIITLLLTVVVTMIGTFLLPPVYTATVSLRISPIPGSGLDYGDFLYGERLRHTYARIASSGPVLEEVRERLGWELPPAASQVQARVVENTEILEVQVVDEDPYAAEDVANSLAQVLQEQEKQQTAGGINSKTVFEEEITRIESELVQLQEEYDRLLQQPAPDLAHVTALSDRIRRQKMARDTFFEYYVSARANEITGAHIISVIDPAVTPEAPTSPRPLLNLVGAVAVGLLVGVVLALLSESLQLE